MKQVIAKKRKYSYKDVSRWFFILMVTFISLYAYTFLAIWIYDLSMGIQFQLEIRWDSWGILYPLTFGPIISAVAQIIYSERGSLSMRAIMWFHVLLIIVLVPTVIVLTF
ncbi:hypothetical protein [Candidatus Mycoplasma mahonii]|uniref:hypothetical protein n=1 Tax=Candidatus Mycoplasma mahonii TaxID=3004105 RepID=UPI0026EDE385|nr:hypothetical protein [Candidatus Mycoplasma mahonii]WKX02254.1 hypothetical protein O3I44_02520 [Candidatus Mycoplasma mahonii]